MAWQVGHPLLNDGTSQSQRLSDALRPENNLVDGRNMENILKFLYDISDQIAFYDFDNRLAGGWKIFFSDLEDDQGNLTSESINKFIKETERRSYNKVSISIILAFLHLFQLLQSDLNELTKKHLEFYFKEVLGFKPKPPEKDQVHVVFKLAPNFDQYKLVAGTLLKAGEDSTGNPLTYITNREIIVNQAELAGVKTTLISENGQVYKAEKANLSDEEGFHLPDASVAWPTFGDPKVMQLCGVGLAIASPLLLLREGRRFINVEILFNESLEVLSQINLNNILCYGSGEENWILLENSQANIGGQQPLLSLELSIDSVCPAIVNYDAQNLEGNLDTSFPVLKFIPDPQKGNYTEFRELSIKTIKLTAGVYEDDGIQDVLIENDSGLLDNTTTIQPFGASPGVGYSMSIGNREVFSKPLDNLNIHLHWLDLPDDSEGFYQYYGAGDPKNYPLKYRLNDWYKVKVYLLKDKNWINLGSYKLFQPDYGILSDRQTLELRNFGELPFITLPEFEGFSRNLPQGFIKLTLIQDFGHSIYPGIFQQVAASQVPTKVFPNEPYTPTLKSISLSYSATQTIQANRSYTDSQLFHIYPFGSQELIPSNEKTSFLPGIPPASLYLGISSLKPPENLHLLFQLLEGSEILEPGANREKIEWDYLTYTGWRNTTLEGTEIFVDTTDNLKRSGIMAIGIDNDASNQNRQMPLGFHWLRAAFPQDPAAVAKTINIHTQAISAEFKDRNNDPDHLLRPLPDRQINTLAVPNPAIESVEQPYESFDGRPSESSEYFYARVSESIRHKHRAATHWDVERLILNRFPDIYKIKAIPHTGFNKQGYYSEFSPGQVSLVAIPQLHGQNVLNPLKPMVSTAKRDEIRNFILPFTSAFLNLKNDGFHVINPRFEPILLQFSVGFLKGVDAGYYAQELNHTLVKYLSPWAFEEGEDIQFGGKIYRSQLLAFMEGLDYVDYVTDFNMFHQSVGPGLAEMCIDIDFIVRDSELGVKTDVALASTAASILVSADHHIINVLAPDEYPCIESNICDEGIGCWYVDIDFVIT